MATEGTVAGTEAAELNMLELEPMEFEEEDLATSSSSIADTMFDLTIGYIEDIIMEDEFQNMQTEFLEKYYAEFEDSEENKFVYTDIHKEYIDLIERYIEDQLKERMPDFKMTDFTGQLESRKDELEGEVFEMLMTFSDFMSFKELFLDYKAMKEGRAVDMSQGITVTSMCLQPGFSPHCPMEPDL